MHSYTKYILEALKINPATATAEHIEYAEKVEDQMGSNGVDFSECNMKEFNREALLANAELQQD